MIIDNNKINIYLLLINSFSENFIYKCSYKGIKISF